MDEETYDKARVLKAQIADLQNVCDNIKDRGIQEIRIIDKSNGVFSWSPQNGRLILEQLEAEVQTKQEEFDAL